MSSKKILSVKPTKNPHKFIFETEMSADELKKYVHEWFDDRACNVYIDSIKPSGLWANKLFVNVSFDQHELPGFVLGELCRLMNDFNRNLEVEEKNRESTCLWKICYKSANLNNLCTIENTPAYVKDLIERAKAFSCGTVYVSSFGGRCNDSAYASSIKVFDEKWTRIWPKETEKLWSIHFKSSITKCDHVLMNTREYAEKLIAHLKAGNRYAQLIDPKKNKCFVADVDTIKVFNEKNEQLWPRETEQKKTYCTIELAHRTGVIHVSHETADTVVLHIKEYRRCVEERTPTAGCIHVRGKDDDHVFHFNDIKHIYDENGNDMLKDVLKKPEDDKCGCVIGLEWKYPVKKSYIPKLISMLNDTNIRVIDVARSDYGPVSVFKTAILEVKDENNEIIWRKKSEDTTFKAPSLLSRIYE